METALLESKPSRPVYLDCAATTPVDPEVAELVMHYMVEEFGNAGSRTHEYGAAAAKAVNHAREQVAGVVGARSDDVIFTSGATEANNLAILGLAEYGRAEGRMHIVSTQIEHKAVLEPLEEMERRGFEVTLLAPNSGGWVEHQRVLDAVREDTLLVSVMHVNNETGVIQPIAEIADGLCDHVYMHTDAAQGFGKDLDPLQHERIDLLSVSGHKIHAPKGVGALISRRRNFKRAPLEPLMFGGGQERGLRPGTQPVALIAGLGLAAEIAVSQFEEAHAHCLRVKEAIWDCLLLGNAQLIGDRERLLASTLNVAIPDFDSEALMLLLKDVLLCSNGAACTSSSYVKSHVLQAMGCSDNDIGSSIRLSWSRTTSEDSIVEACQQFKNVVLGQVL